MRLNNLILLKLFFIIFATAIVLAGCRDEQQRQDERQKQIGETTIPELSEMEKKKSEIQPKRADLPAPKELKATNPGVPAHFESELPDFSDYSSISDKKHDFFAFLLPIIQNENNKVIEERRYVLSLLSIVNGGGSLSDDELQNLQNMAAKYRVHNTDTGSEDFFVDLLLHVDVIPPELALAQAANESAWGSSYFARKGNNLFGQWCFSPGCGEVPRRRKEGDTHEVAVFDDLDHSVESYILYLNSHPAFRQLRVVRYEARQNGIKPSGYDMAAGLEKYSGIGMEYVNTLRSMMRHNKEYMGLDTDRLQEGKNEI
jgi:Bax protein